MSRFRPALMAAVMLGAKYGRLPLHVVQKKRGKFVTTVGAVS